MGARKKADFSATPVSEPAGEQRLTPVMLQHAQAKRAHPDALLFFRMGDFFELFGEDAVVASRALDLTLTARNRGKPDEIPMAGVPHHAAHGYIARLLAQGFKVAICEQMADPSKVRGIVPREVVRVITPGTITDAEQLVAAENNWLAALELAEGGAVGIALLDLSTGELLAARVPELTSLLAELSRTEPRELLLGRSPSGVEDGEVSTAGAAIGAVMPRVPVRADGELTANEVEAALGELASDAAQLEPETVRAVARALRFARICQPRVELPVRRIARWDPTDAMVIDQTAQQHLELVASANGRDRGTTLLGVLDVTRTAMGARLLRRRLLAPLIDVERIRRRLDEVQLFVESPRLREDLRTELDAVTDLERLAVRAALREATPRELAQLRDGLAAAARATALLDALTDRESRSALSLDPKPDLVTELQERLALALLERPSPLAKEGEIFRAGFDASLDELDHLRQSGGSAMVELEERLRAETNIPSLKVRYTRVFGWYIEISRSQAARTPASFRRKQTVATGERYSTPELDDLADKILHAEERHRERELALLTDLGKDAALAAHRVRALAARLAAWDVASALAELAHRYDYCRPDVNRSTQLELIDGRHPVVERLSAAGRFVPNDVALDVDGERLWLVTGPNMAGKSTLLRQTALAAIMAQAGSYVPARRATVGVVDRVLSRVGASDDLARGESTFMVEMRETAAILRHATRRSLVILDEIGRGTSTFDGLAIAWAVAEHLDEVIGCRALFATHYHELTAFAEASEHAANHSVSARELGDDIVFLHRLVRGPASRSYGVAVARLAGLPESVLARAKALLETFEVGGAAEPKAAVKGRKSKSTSQLDLFAPSLPPERAAAQDEVARTLRAVDPERLAPLDALALVVKLRQKLLG